MAEEVNGTLAQEAGKTQNIASTSFSKLGLCSDLCERLAEMKVCKPTAIQARSFRPIVDSGDQPIFLRAPTGTGKTLAYLLPILNDLLSRRDHSGWTKIVLVVPTRELGMQVQGIIKRLISGSSLSVCAVFGGDDFNEQWRDLVENPPTILIGTPSRLHELFSLEGARQAEERDLFSWPGSRRTIQQKKIDFPEYLGRLEYLIVDEADAVFSPLGKHASPKEILKRSLKPRKSVLFCSYLKEHVPELRIICASASSNKRTRDIVSRIGFQGIHVRVQTEELEAEDDSPGKQKPSYALPKALGHSFVILHEIEDQPTNFQELNLEQEYKIQVLASILEECQGVIGGVAVKRAIIFVDNHCKLEPLLTQAESLDVSVIPLHTFMSLPKEEQDTLLTDFDSSPDAGALLLLGTEQTARGIDLPWLTHAFILCSVNEDANYVHMAGRVARMEQEGHVVSILAGWEGYKARRWARQFQVQVRELGTVEVDSRREEVEENASLPTFVPIPWSDSENSSATITESDERERGAGASSQEHGRLLTLPRDDDPWWSEPEELKEYELVGESEETSSGEQEGVFEMWDRKAEEEEARQAKREAKRRRNRTTAEGISIMFENNAPRVNRTGTGRQSARARQGDSRETGKQAEMYGSDDQTQTKRAGLIERLGLRKHLNVGLEPQESTDTKHPFGAYVSHEFHNVRPTPPRATTSFRVDSSIHRSAQGNERVEDLWARILEGLPESTTGINRTLVPDLGYDSRPSHRGADQTRSQKYKKTQERDSKARNGGREMGKVKFVSSRPGAKIITRSHDQSWSEFFEKR